jgi:hypothetical protein
MVSTTLHYRVDRHKIGYLKFIFEGYDGLGTLSTIDASKGIVVLKVPPGCEDDTMTVIQGLADEIHLEPWFDG